MPLLRPYRRPRSRDDGIEFLLDTMRQLNKLDKAARWAAKKETPCHSVSFQAYTGMPGHENALSSHTTGGHRGTAKERCRFQRHVQSNHVTPCTDMSNFVMRCDAPFLLRDGRASYTRAAKNVKSLAEKQCVKPAARRQSLA